MTDIPQCLDINIALVYVLFEVNFSYSEIIWNFKQKEEPKRVLRHPVIVINFKSL